MIDKGQRVKCFMRTNLILEGIVEEWSASNVILKSLEDNNLIIIHKPLDDIMVTKILNTKTIEAPIKSEEPLKSEIKDKLDEIMNSENPNLESLNLKILKNLVIEQDKKIIKEKRVEHFGAPGAIKKAAEYTEHKDLFKRK